MTKQIPVSHALLLFAVYIVALFWQFIFNPPGEPVSQLELIQSGLSVSILSASVLLLLYLLIRRVGEPLGFSKAEFKGAWIMIYPLALILILLVFFATNGFFNEVDTWKWILINCLLVGFSEELMFRGFLYSVALRKLGMLKAVLYITLLFGVVHILNGFITGDWAGSTMQAVLASFSGLLFFAIRIKTKSIFPGMLVHAFFDFIALGRQAIGFESTETLQVLIGLLLVISPLIFGVTGFIQLRKLIRAPKSE